MDGEILSPEPEQPEGRGKSGLPARRQEIIEAVKHKLEPYNERFGWIIDDLAGRVSPDEGDLRTISPMQAAAKPIQLGMSLLLGFFVVFGLWAAFAPIESAAVAQGKLVVETNRKTIQHLEGGIIEEIAVKGSDIVKKGQVLMRLRSTGAKARKDLVLGQFRANKALEARLLAEQAEQAELTFPPELLELKDDPKVAEILDTQQKQFATRRTTYVGQTNILNQKLAQLREEIGGLQAQERSTRQQMALIHEEVVVVKKLLESGNAPRPRLLALQRRQAELEGIRGQYSANIAKAQQAMGETEMEILNIKNTFQSNVIKELRDVQVQLSDLEENLKASQDVFDRTDILAPIDGTVNDLKYHTVGGVVTPGSPIMEVIPVNDRIIVEAMVQPQDIDIVHVGLDARVRLTPFKARRVPPIDGKVTHLSADIFSDQRTGLSYYTARIEIDGAFVKQLKDVELYPGMPVDVLIVTGERSMLSYLLSPIQDSMYRAFREQ